MPGQNCLDDLVRIAGIADVGAEVVAGAERDYAEDRALLGGDFHQPVDDLVGGAVAADRHDHVVAFQGGLFGQLLGVGRVDRPGPVGVGKAFEQVGQV